MKITEATAAGTEFLSSGGWDAGERVEERMRAVLK
jgi:hypothetical protein